MYSVGRAESQSLYAPVCVSGCSRRRGDMSMIIVCDQADESVGNVTARGDRHMINTAHEKLAAHSGNAGLVVVEQRDELLDGGIAP